jgi:hypothetical protein
MRLAPCAAIASALACFASACSSPGGPASPYLVNSPRTQVTVTPDLLDVLTVPDLPNAQLFLRQPDGVLRYQFQIQNVIDEAFAVRVDARFFDERGAEVSKDGPTRVHFDPHQRQTISVSSLNNLAHSVQVQVMPAR